MAFEGDLKELEFGDVVQTLSMTRQHGTLVVHGREERRVAFSERGMALLTARRSHKERVGRYLVGRGHADPEAVSTALRATRRSDGPTLGDALLDVRAVDPQALLEARRYVAQDDLFDLFSWPEGRFEFHNDDLDLSGPFASVWFDVGGVAMEAARRLDETPQLDHLAAEGEVLVPDDPAAAPLPDEAPASAVELYRLADGTRTVGGIGVEHYLGAFDTRKGLAALVASGALRPATAPEIIAAAETVEDAARAARLLRRAVALEPASVDSWEKLAKALAASAEKGEAATALCEVADLQYGVGETEAALETLRAALKLHRQCPRAHAQLTRILFALDEIEDGVNEARKAVSDCLAGDAPQTALEIATAALEHAPWDVRLTRGLAAAHATLGSAAEAVGILDKLVHELTRGRANERELIEVYRSILSLAPDRADCREKIRALAQRAALRKRRRTQIAAAAAVLLLVGSIALPSMLGTDVQARLDEMNELASRGELDRVQELLNDLRAEDIDEELLANAIAALQRRVEASRRPPLDPSLATDLQAELEEIYESSRTALAERRITAGLELLARARPSLESERVATIRNASPDTAKRFRDGFDTEVKSALTETEEHCQAIASEAARAFEELDASEALKRARLTTVPEDLPELRRLAELAEQVDALDALAEWEAVPELVNALIEATTTPPHELRERIGKAVENLVTSLRQARASGAHAVAHLHRLRLLTEFRDARSRGADHLRDGQVEEAAALYRDYLELCGDVRANDRGDVYERIVRGYMDTFQLEDLIEEQLEQAETILARERSAAQALRAGDVATSFHMRVALVREFPHVGFSTRFSLPLRVATVPAGADIILRRDGTETVLGKTTSIVSYPAVGESTIVVRLPGFEEIVLERHGAFEDSDGNEELELAKKPVWSSRQAAATEASPVAWRDRVFVADRDGVVRALSIADGTEVGRLETGLLGGFASSPAVRDGTLFLASVDGVGFVVDAETLEIRRRFDLPGAVRTSLVATHVGVVMIDERGTVHMVDARGDDVWRRDVGNVVVDPETTDDRVVLVTLDGRLVVLGIEDGAERRTVRLPGRPRWSAPTVAGDHAYVSTESGTLAAVDLRRGVVSWEKNGEKPYTGRPAVVDERLAVPTADGRIRLISATTGEEHDDAGVWGPVGDGVLALEDGFVAVGRTGAVRRLDCDGALVWRFEAEDAVSARPVWFEDRLVLVTRAGVVIVLED